MLCCGQCFNDRGLKKQIIPQSSTERGTCPICGSTDQALIEPIALGDYFEFLIGIYRPDEDGKLLVEWLIEDWVLFKHSGIDQARANALLAAILDDGEIVRQKFVPMEQYQSDRLDHWEKLRQELMHRNRFFPDTEFDRERLEDLLSSLILDKDDESNLWYRARIEKGGQPYPVKEMGAPPERVASHGRANPAGIPYLYLGSTQQTAVAEVRPHPGERVCVAEFVIDVDLQIVDLREPRSLVSPFLLSDESAVGLLRGDIEFLERLGQELTTPVLPMSAAIDYIPSQYLCEFIKKCGYHGLIYSSSVSDGVNLALFDPAKAKVGDTKEFEVTRVTVDMIQM